jgi:hypothetical protein
MLTEAQYQGIKNFKQQQEEMTAITMDRYTHGIRDGLEIVLSVIERREPQFLSFKEQEWLM